MTEKIVRVTGAVVILALLGGIAFLCFRLNRVKRDKDRLSLLYDRLSHRKPDTVVIFRDTTIFCPVMVKPVPLPVPDTVRPEDPAPVIHYYDETFSIDSVSVHWKALGDIRWIRFPEISFPYRKTTIIHPVTRVDTLAVCPRRLHLGLYARVLLRDMACLPGIDAGVQLSFSLRGGVTLGCMRDPRGTFYVSVGAFVNIF